MAQTEGNTEGSIDTLVSISGTMASIALALVGILAAKSSLDHVETITDDLFLYASLGFLAVLLIGYVARKRVRRGGADRLMVGAEWLFSLSMALVVLGGILLVYTEV